MTIDSYRHRSARRANLPTEQTEAAMSDRDKAPRPFTPSGRARDQDPVLAWERENSTSAVDGSSSDPDAVDAFSSDAGGADASLSDQEDAAHAPRVHAAHPLYVREKIDPRAFAESLKRSHANGREENTLFSDFNGLKSPSAAFEWYEHEGNWQNRIIHGESARVMASLAEREDLTGRVQMIYFDPPYGIGFKSNFQVSTRRRETPTGRKGLPNDPRTVRAFRDTYERGVHSYLDQMHQKLTLCRELLAESGSVFVQIGDENVHRMALVLDEVFGHENRVATIPYATSGSTSARTLPSVADFLLWYAKDKPTVKYRQLYEHLNRKQKIKHMSFDAMVELADGTTRSLTAAEKHNPDKELPNGARAYRRMRLASPGRSTPVVRTPFTGESQWKGWTGSQSCSASTRQSVKVPCWDGSGMRTRCPAA